MKLFFYLFLAILIWSGCDTKQPEKEDSNPEIFNCKTGLMKPAWYVGGMDEPIPDISGLKSDFIILVDTNLKAKNFISIFENYARKRSTELDTSFLAISDDWSKLSLKQKLERARKDRIASKITADSTHFLNNQGQQQIWLINNSQHPISIQMQDGSYICILQARTKKGQWLPIQYWRYSTCGNSYYYKTIPPKTANSFITKLPKGGDYETKLRFKLLGKFNFYYSNEFPGKINYCEFQEDPADYNDRMSRQGPHFKLDSLIRLPMHD